jgi:hypothetical protein
MDQAVERVKPRLRGRVDQHRGNPGWRGHGESVLDEAGDVRGDGLAHQGDYLVKGISGGGDTGKIWTVGTEGRRPCSISTTYSALTKTSLQPRLPQDAVLRLP